MFQLIYSKSLSSIVFAMLIALIVWGCLRNVVRRRIWTIANLTLFAAAVLTILYATLVNREPGEYDVILTPFAAFAAARKQPELYREMLMNVFLFFPLGLTLSNALPQRWRLWRRIAAATLAGCLLSGGIEYGQYWFSLGLAEMDDVICNTLGVFLGSVSLLVAGAIEKIQRKAAKHDADKH